MNRVKQIAVQTFDERMQVFDVVDYRIGFGIGLLTMGLEYIFTNYFPTISWIPYVYKFDMQGSLWSLISILAKIGIEVKH